jgi:hypothetical protein
VVFTVLYVRCEDVQRIDLHASYGFAPRAAIYAVASKLRDSGHPGPVEILFNLEDHAPFTLVVRTGISVSRFVVMNNAVAAADMRCASAHLDN